MTFRRRRFAAAILLSARAALAGAALAPRPSSASSRGHLPSLPHLLLATSGSSEHGEGGVEVTYESARRIRTRSGHAAAVPLYRSLLSSLSPEEGKDDPTAASRIAAARSSPLRHDLACPVDVDSSDWEGDVRELRDVLRNSGYDNRGVGALFGVARGHRLCGAAGPVYLRAASAGIGRTSPLNLEEDDDGDLNVDGDSESAATEGAAAEKSRRCLAALFLLGFSVPRSTLSEHLVGGEGTVQLLGRLGLAFPCELDPNLVVPYVHIFPLDVEVIDSGGSDIKGRTEAIILVTDCHPSVLSRTTVGTDEDGAVMYIGPDSLALVQHLPLSDHFAGSSDAEDDRGQQRRRRPLRVLDLCSGSGVQAIASLVALSDVTPDAAAVCVDVNPRAVRFARFNAALNGVGERVIVIRADLMCGRVVDVGENGDGGDAGMGGGADLGDTLLGLGHGGGKFDLILSNPPFIPVPPPRSVGEAGSDTGKGSARDETASADDDGAGNDKEEVLKSIERRYGLFSSGGSDGEDVLMAAVILAGKVLREDNGLVGIVSEFMDPPPPPDTAAVDTDERQMEEENLAGQGVRGTDLLRRIREWWDRNPARLADERAFDRSPPEPQPEVPPPPRSAAEGVLFTNLLPVSAETYASRRADDEAERRAWTDHLRDGLGVDAISPGLLFVRSRSRAGGAGEGKDDGAEEARLRLIHRLVLKTEGGSIWTPGNTDSMEYVRGEWSRSLL